MTFKHTVEYVGDTTLVTITETAWPINKIHYRNKRVKSSSGTGGSYGNIVQEIKLPFTFPISGYGAYIDVGIGFVRSERIYIH